MKKNFSFPDFINFQRESFYNFLKKGFINQFENRKKIESPKKNIELIFYPEKFKIKLPELSTKKSILLGKSYTGKIFVPIQFINKKKRKIKIQWVLLANIPLMTKRGHFILNGAPRIIISQMIRNPGIYFYEINKKKPLYYADFICYRGTWLRIEMDKKNKIWVKMKKIKKFSIFLLLQSFGLTQKDIYQNIKNWEILHESLLEEYHPKNTKEALSKLYEIIQTKKENEFTKYLNRKYGKYIKPGYKFLFRKLLNPRNYDLSEGGRINLNKKLELSISEKKRTLTAEDLLFGTNKLLQLYIGAGQPDDIDSLKNRRIRPSGEILENQIFLGLTRLEKYIRERYRKNRKKLSVKALISTKPINGALREFFGSSQLSQFMDQTNPLAELTHKRRVTSIGPNGVSRETAGMAIRGIHSTHYGRICPIETPEGKNAGLVNSITTLARINSFGFIETPLFKVHKGQIQKNLTSIYFSAEVEENFYIAPPDLKKTNLSFLPEKKILSRLGKNFKDVFSKKIDYISVFPIQLISIATSLIPFMEHDDGNRALMGSNMQRQAVPLLVSERALVGTGLESQIISNTGYSLQARITGYISYIGGGSIVIQTGSFKKNTLFLKNFLFLKNLSPYKKNFFFFTSNKLNGSNKLLFSKQIDLINFFSFLFLQANPFYFKFSQKKNLDKKKIKSIDKKLNFSGSLSKNKKLKKILLKNKKKKKRNIFFIRKK
jgi:DNA-directed RNA polymerase subunit beta